MADALQWGQLAHTIHMAALRATWITEPGLWCQGIVHGLQWVTLCFSRLCPAPLQAASPEPLACALTFTINLGATCAEGPPPLLGTGQTDVEELWGKAEKASSCEQAPGASFLQPDAHHHPALTRSAATGKREHLNPTKEGRAEAATLGVNSAETTGRPRLGPSPSVSVLNVLALRGENECSQSGLTPEP